MLSKRGLLGLWTERMDFVKIKFLWSFNDWQVSAQYAIPSVLIFMILM